MADLTSPAAAPKVHPEAHPETHLEQWQATLNWQPDQQQQQQFQQLYQQLLSLNQQVNLTRITTPTDFWEKHLWDSLSGIAPWLGQAPEWADLGLVERVIDIGTGGGFPGVPVAIARPDWSMTLLDATRKKVQATEAIAQALGLRQLTCIAERAEIIGQNPLHRGCYDLALVRAVGTASTCAEYALPLLKPQGIAVLYRGQWSEAETQTLLPAVEKLGGMLVEARSQPTPITQSERTCLYLKKVAVTDSQYPRNNGIPAKFPL